MDLEYETKTKLNSSVQHRQMEIFSQRAYSGALVENYLEKNITGGDSCQTNQEFSLNQARIVNHDLEDDLENT